MAPAALLKIQNPAKPDAIQVGQMQDRPQKVPQAPPPATVHRVTQKTQASPAASPAARPAARKSKVLSAARPATQKSQASPSARSATQKSQAPPAAHPAAQKSQAPLAARPAAQKSQALPAARLAARKSQAPPAARPAARKANTSAPPLTAIQAQVQNLHPAKPGKTHKVHNNPQVVKPWVLKPKGTAGRSAPLGYNIQEAMGLGNNWRLYNAYCVSHFCSSLSLPRQSLQEAARLLAIEHLDIKKTISSQEKYNVSLVLVKVGPFLCAFKR